ncbi:hypothetical protein GCM10022419_105640 [Nonomuraea rosea]|uniref:Uncharacterized protein n=1 Tax=Nonomuraea rosea TaxID=638574 RepID=A0ABP6ZAR7_9ACTN
MTSDLSRVALLFLKIPGPRGQWLVGQLLAYECDRMSWLRTNQADYGDIIRLAPHAVVVYLG